ncbi:MAG: VWA domain-containing protein [Pseudomonadota bacterium]
MKPFPHVFKRLCLLTLGLAAASSAFGKTMLIANDRTPSSYAKTIDFTASLATPVIKAGKAQSAFLKVGLTGFDLPARGDRPAANVAIVIDKSGSMSGERIERAKEAAIMAVNGLSPNDIVAIVAFDNTVEVVTPATKVADKAAITHAIKNIRVAGGTGLFAGVSKGAFEVRKFFDKTRVNRVILLSDGQANAGPSSPAELGQLGGMLAREGISVTTIGLGSDYNEDLMTQLAAFSDGNHAFVQNSSDLARIFKHEFGDVGSVVAQEVELTIRLKRGIRPIRILGREGEITDGVVRLRMNQLYSQQEKYVLLEVEVPAGKAGENLDLAAVDVSYLNMHSKNKDKLSRAVAVSFSESSDTVAKAVDKKVMVSAVQQVANEVNKEALKMRDSGKFEEAKKLNESNAAYLADQAVSLGSAAAPVPALKAQESSTLDFNGYLRGATGENDGTARKKMKEDQFKLEKQQR